MQTARVTVLMTPDRKADIDERAARLGVSTGEYLRLAADNYDRISADDEAELAALVAEVNAAIPKMQASLDRSCERMEVLHAEMEDFFREKGIA